MESIQTTTLLRSARIPRIVWVMGMQQTSTEYKTRHDWVRGVAYWELCKILNFDHTTKYYMHDPESNLENEMQNISRDFEILTDHLILDRRPDLVLIQRKKKEKRRKQ